MTIESSKQDTIASKKPKKKSPSKKKRKTRGFDNDLLDKILGDYKDPEDLIGKGAVLDELVSAVVSRAMSAEMTEHLGYESGEPPPVKQRNRRNGRRKKKLRSEHGELVVDIPRDREGTFEPKLVPKHSREFRGFDQKILAMYARGMSVRDIRAHLEELYGVEVSPDLISRATDAVVDELRQWQNRPLDAVYPVIYIDAIHVKIRHEGRVQNRAVHVVVGVAMDGHRDVLGMWIADHEGAKFWLSVLTELKERGVEDIFMLCADGLKGIPEAVEATFPKTVFQTCVVHLIRSSMKYVPYQHRKAICKDLRALYGAINEKQARKALETLDATWGKQFPFVVKTWRNNWEQWTPFLAYPPEIRRVVYTTNAIEALHRFFRKAFKTRGHMPSDEAALKLMFLVMRNAKKTWGRRYRAWTQALAQFAILFEDRIPS